MDNELYALAYLGDQAEKFWQTDIGQYIESRISQDEADSIEELISFDNQRARDKIFMIRSIRSWLSEIINEGQQARQQIEELE